MQGWSCQELKLWCQGCKYLAGVDEAGRGPLAGPVVAAAVILPQDFEANGVNDSKLLTEMQREEIVGRIKEEAIAWAVAAVSHARIDRINILQATFAAMQRAVSRLAVTPGHLLVDGNMVVPSLTIPPVYHHQRRCEGCPYCLCIDSRKGAPRSSNVPA